MQNEQISNVAQTTIVETENLQAADEKKTISGQDIIVAIREMAERLGKYPSMPELTQAYPAIKMGMVRKYFAGYGDALREAGFEGGGCGYTVTLDALFRDWARLARKYQRCPTMSEYERESKYSVRPLVGRFRVWSQVPRGLYGYAEHKELDVEFRDVLEIIEAHYGDLGTGMSGSLGIARNAQNCHRIQIENPKPLKRRGTEEAEEDLDIGIAEYRDSGNCQEDPGCQTIQSENSRPLKFRWADEQDQVLRPQPRATPPQNAQQQRVPGAPAAVPHDFREGRIDPRRWEAREVRPRKAPILPDRPIFGPPMVDTALACGPTNENGVIFLFGSLARELGFVVMRIQTEFPDCLALRYIGDDRWQLIRIEFEYQSRNFLKHMHDAKKCDLIVCWEHNWKECPVEVIELREILKIQNL